MRHIMYLLICMFPFWVQLHCFGVLLTILVDDPFVHIKDTEVFISSLIEGLQMPRYGCKEENDSLTIDIQLILTV